MATKQEIQEYYKTPEGKKVDEFIHNPVQDAVVYDIQNMTDYTRLMCYSPVWKEITISLWGTFKSQYSGVQRGDILALSRKEQISERGVKFFTYSIEENKTQKEIKQRGIDKILEGFFPSQKKNIFFISECERHER